MYKKLNIMKSRGQNSDFVSVIWGLGILHKTFNLL